MSDERVPRRLHLAREGSRVHLDARHLDRLATRLETRRHRPRPPRLALFATVATAVIVTLLFLRPRRPDVPGAGGHRAMVAPISTAARGPRLTVPPPAPVPAADRDASPGPLADLAADPRGSALWAAYLRSPDDHPVIPNVSQAGAHPGEPVPTAVINVRAEPFRAAGDGVTDDTEALRRALEAVSATGGTVYLPDGDYLVSSVLFLSSSRTVLRGESRDRTRLVFTRPLDELLGTNIEGPYSRWQWSGGLVWIAPRARRPSLEGGGAGWKKGGWPAGPEIARLASAARRGDRSIQVESSAGLRAGALVLLVADTIEPSDQGGAWPVAPTDRGPKAVTWPVEIASVEGRRVTLRQALRFDLSPGGNARLLDTREADLVRDSGIERMTLVMRRNRQWDALGVGEVHGWNGVFFEAAVNAFARELVVIDGHTAAATSSSKNLTLADLTLKSTGVSERAVFPRGIAIGTGSHDVLVDRIDVDPRYWFRLRLEGSGHAVSRVRGRLRKLGGPAADSLLTDLTVLQPREEPLPAPPGPRIVGWGIRYDRPGAERPAIEPANLYEAQQRAR